MPKDRKFVNPLTKASEPGESASTNTSTYTSTESTENRQPDTSRRKDQTFEQLHERMTAWVDKKLKRKFEALVKKEHSSKTALLNEALTDLLEKYQNR